MSYFHDEERSQVWALERYARHRPAARFLIAFADAESYVCTFDTAYDSDNSGELDIEMDHPAYDEFHQVTLRVIQTINKGLRPYNEWLNLDYRDFPVLIKDLDSGTVIYREGSV